MSFFGAERRCGLRAISEETARILRTRGLIAACTMLFSCAANLSAQASSFRLADANWIYGLPLSDTEVVHDSCGGSHSRVYEHGIVSMMIAEVHFDVGNANSGRPGVFPLLVDATGTWTPVSIRFQSSPSLGGNAGGKHNNWDSWPDFPDPIWYPLHFSSSNFGLTLSKEGIITGEESGSTNSIPKQFGSYFNLSGQVTWSGKETIDLKSGRDNFTFDAQFAGQYPKGKGSKKCTVSAHYSGTINTVLTVKFRAITYAPPRPPPPTLVDPVTIANSQNPATLLSTPQQLVSATARKIVGVAADGVTRAVVRIPTIQPHQKVTVSVCGEKPDEATCGKLTSDEYGSISTSVEDALSGHHGLEGIWQSSASGQSGPVEGSSNPVAFVVYRSPLDFVRKASPGRNEPPKQNDDNTCPNGAEVNDCRAISRTVFLRLRSDAGPDQWLPITVIRPPVVLVHGFNADSSAWGQFEEALFEPMSELMLKVYRVDYGQRVAGSMLHIKSSIPEIRDLRGAVALDYVTRQSHFGFTFVSPCVFDQIQEALGDQFVNPATGHGEFQRICLSKSILTGDLSFREGGIPQLSP